MAKATVLPRKILVNYLLRLAFDIILSSIDARLIDKSPIK